MFDQISDWGNLLLAHQLAAKGKRGKAAAATFELRMANELITLQDELSAHLYRPGAYHHFFIHEPKRRRISAAPFRDRVVHHALCNVMEPIFEARFIDDSYANRKNKGTHRAVDRLQQLAHTYRYVLRADIVQHFPSLDHAILRQQLAHVIDDEDVLWLINVILKSGRGAFDNESEQNYFPGDDLFTALRPRGLPIGNLPSQFCHTVKPIDAFENILDARIKLREKSSGGSLLTQRRISTDQVDLQLG